MALFITTRRPVTGLLVDGLLWGGIVGAVLTSPLVFLVGVGPVVGALCGGLAGLVAGAVLQLTGRHLASANVATLVATTAGAGAAYLLGVAINVALQWPDVVWERPVDSIGAFLAVLTSVPLLVDVALRARGRLHRPGPSQDDLRAASPAGSGW